DLVVANILAETLVEMHASLAESVRDGGILILSGIEARRLKMVEEAFIRVPWRLVRAVTRGDWASLCLQRALAEQVPGLSLPAMSDGDGTSETGSVSAGAGIRSVDTRAGDRCVDTGAEIRSVDSATEYRSRAGVA